MMTLSTRVATRGPCCSLYAQVGHHHLARATETSLEQRIRDSLLFERATHCVKAASASHPCELHDREMVRRGDGP